MTIKTINKLCCPFDKQNLLVQVIAKDTSENILEGMLSCFECKRQFPIIHGVPIMTPDEYRRLELEKPLQLKWEKQTGIFGTHQQ